MTTTTIELPDMSGWTVESLDAALTAICEANPHAVNPRQGRMDWCLYEDAEGRNCLIGYLLELCGIRTDNAGQPLATVRTAAQWLLPQLGFPVRVGVRAGEWQAHADRGSVPVHNGRCIPWGALPTMVDSVSEEMGSEEF